jgi:hypothetical protein
MKKCNSCPRYYAYRHLDTFQYLSSRVNDIPFSVLPSRHNDGSFGPHDLLILLILVKWWRFSKRDVVYSVDIYQ